MPIIKSAKKRVKTAEKAAVRNSKTKRSVRTSVKAFVTSLTGGKNAPKAHASAQSAIDKAAKNGVMHKNKAARKKAQLARQAKAANVKVAGSKSAAKAAVKPTAKKATAKPVAKKAPAKAVKKPAAKKKA